MSNDDEYKDRRKEKKFKVFSDKPFPVQDEIAETRIKWGVIAQSLIFLLLSGIGVIGLTYFERVMTTMSDGMQSINKNMGDINGNLVQIRREISGVNTGVQINATQIESMKTHFGRRLDKYELLIEKNGTRIQHLHFDAREKRSK